MSSFTERLLPMVNQARGRCHSCANHQAFDLPVSGTVHYCRAYSSEFDQAARDEVRNCPRWAPFHPADGSGRAERTTRNPLFGRIIDAEDQLFWQLKARLDEVGADLKTVMLLAQPAIRSAIELEWVDTLDARFGDESSLEVDVAPLAEIVEELRALRYDSVCDVLEMLDGKSGARAHVDATGSWR